MRAKIVLSLVLFILCASQAWASEWILYGKSTVGDEYYDKNSIKKINNNVIQVWTKIIFNDVGKVKNYSVLKRINKAPVNPYLLSHEMILFEIDCLRGKIKVSSGRICDKRGGVIASDLKTHDKWSDIVPKSNFEKLKNQSCSLGKNSKIKNK